MDQKMNITAFSPEMQKNVEAKREWIKGFYASNADALYQSYDNKLKLIDTIITQKLIEQKDVLGWQCLGIALGDALAQKLGLDWVQVEDEYGTDPALRWKETSIILFPQTMISKRIERNEEVDVYFLIGELEKALEKYIDDKDIV